jgi:hypothetical protein
MDDNAQLQVMIIIIDHFTLHALEMFPIRKSYPFILCAVIGDRFIY